MISNHRSLFVLALLGAASVATSVVACGDSGSNPGSGGTGGGTGGIGNTGGAGGKSTSSSLPDASSTSTSTGGSNSSGGGGSTSTNSGGGGSSSFVKIQKIQDDAMPSGTPVQVKDVVVTAIDTFGGKKGNFWVEEKEGGPKSGVLVFNGPAATVATLHQGDIVTITGAQKNEFALATDTSGRTDTELEPVGGGMMVITKTGTGAVPTPVKVDALAIGQMADADTQGPLFSAAWEQWEGVLVEIDNVSALGAVKSFGSTTPVPADNYSFPITGLASVEGSLVDITSSSIVRGTCMGKVTGVVDYFFNYLILPRSAADFTTDGTACPAAETTCGDGKDNDGNGFADCLDDNCIVSSATCRSATTIPVLDAYADAHLTSPATPPASANVPAFSLAGACVTAVSDTNFYVAAAGASASDGGLFVFGNGQTLDATVVVGATVDLIGTLDAFKSPGSTANNPLLEFDRLSVTVDATPCVPIAALLTSTMASLTQDANGHPRIGSLVTLTPTSQFKISGAVSNGFGKLQSGGTTVAIGTSLLGPAYTPDAVGSCYASLTGIWTYDTTGAGSYEILPTTAPTKTGTACTGN